MDFIIAPYEGAGSIKFGMTRSEVQHLFQNHKKDEFDRLGEPWDLFDDLWLQVAYSYDFPHRCRAVMMEKPISPIFEGRKLLDGTSLEDLRIWLSSMDDSLEIATEAVKSNKFGIVLSTEDYWDLSHEPPTSVLVFEQGYYDDLTTKEDALLQQLREDKIVNSSFWEKLNQLHNTDTN
jgi:hypothetical protein